MVEGVGSRRSLKCVESDRYIEIAVPIPGLLIPVNSASDAHGKISKRTTKTADGRGYDIGYVVGPTPLPVGICGSGKLVMSLYLVPRSD